MRGCGAGGAESCKFAFLSDSSDKAFNFNLKALQIRFEDLTNSYVAAEMCLTEGKSLQDQMKVRIPTMQYSWFVDC